MARSSVIGAIVADMNQDTIDTVVADSCLPNRKERKRLLLFLISPQIFDFDTFLPVAMTLKSAHPEWRVVFVTFSMRNHEFIMSSPTHRSAIDKTGEFVYLGWDHARTSLGGIALRLRSLLTICGWVLRFARPVLFLQRPFLRAPYAWWYALARLRGGNGYVLWKSRSPDIVHHRLRQVRKEPPPTEISSMVVRLMKRHCDAFIHFHDEQDENIEWASSFGHLEGVPRIKIGLPHYLTSWRDHVEREVDRERQKLREDGVPKDAELYCMFPAKPHSHETLRKAGSIEEAFGVALRTLCKVRPKAFVLFRPHPRILNEPYFRELMADVGEDRARLCFAHPEVLLAMSRRAIFNNPSNLMFSAFQGRFIDVSDYPDQHFKDFGDRSLADGFGAIHVNSFAEDFEGRFAEALDCDDLFDRAGVNARRDELIKRNPADIRPLLNLLVLPRRRSEPPRIGTNERGV